MSDNATNNNTAYDYRQFFRDFIGREGYLKTVGRYGNYPKKLYPTNLDSHQFQVVALVRLMANENIITVPQEAPIDMKRAILLAYIHNDHLPFMTYGDVQSSNESHLTDGEREAIRQDEEQAVQCAIESYPKQLCGYSYAELMREIVFDIDTLESQFVKYCIKLVGLGEAMHEICSGNFTFLERRFDPIFGKGGNPNPHPIDYYQGYFRNLLEKLPLIQVIDSPHHKWLLGPLPEDRLPHNHYHLWKMAIAHYAPLWEGRRLDIRIG